MYRLAAIVVFILLILTCTSKPEYSVPDLQLYDLDSNLVSLHTLLDDGPVFICVWALWAPPCIRELDALNPYYEEMVSYSINMVTIHAGSESTSEIDSLVDQHGWKYTFLLDPDGKVNELHQIDAVPTSLAIDEQGDIVFDYVGYGAGYDTMFVDTLRTLFGNQ